MDHGCDCQKYSQFSCNISMGPIFLEMDHGDSGNSAASHFHVGEIWKLVLYLLFYILVSTADGSRKMTYYRA